MTMPKKILLTTFVLVAVGSALYYLPTSSSNYHDELANNASCSTLEQEMVLIKGGTYTMGAAGVYSEEFPATLTQVDDFAISRYEVTNKEYAEFVETTGYKTLAELNPDPSLYPDIDPKLLTPGSAVFMGLSEAVRAGTLLNWWHFIEGANWQNPTGEDSNIEGMEDYPVVHIAHADAVAYANWKGHRLPTEAEFEYAARGGLIDKKYASGKGDSFVVNGEYQANTWQGIFPFDNSGDDGHIGVAPRGCFDSNGYGVYDMIGNVWEWTSSIYYPQHLLPDDRPLGLPKKGYDPQQPGIAVGVIKGGSYLCADDFCARYRPAARHAQDTGLGTSHIGFRTVKSVEKK